MGKGRRVRRGRERKREMVGKWEGRARLDICPGAAEFLVMPLFVAMDIVILNSTYMLSGVTRGRRVGPTQVKPSRG